MKHILTLIVFLCLTFSASSQNMEVIGKMIVKDLNTIATFQSTAKNSFISISNNDDPNSATNIGFFDNHDDNFDDPYFFIDLVGDGEFGEFMIKEGGNVYIGDLGEDLLNYSSARLNVITSDVNGAIFGIGIGRGNGVSGFSDSGSAVRGLSSTGYGVEGDSDDPNSYDFFAWSNDGSTAYGQGSSIRWKTNIRNISSPIEKLQQLRGVYFNWKEEFGGSHDVGFIAEEVGEVLPEIVVYEDNGIDASGLDYSKMTPLLVEAANAMRAEYQKKFEAQDEKLKAQSQDIQTLKEELALINELLRGKTVPTSDQ